jgi:hypothetical protein
LADAHPDRLVPLAEALAFLPARALSEDEAAAVRHGRRIGGAADRATRLMADDKLIAIAEPQADELQPVVVFEPA